VNPRHGAGQILAQAIHMASDRQVSFDMSYFTLQPSFPKAGSGLACAWSGVIGFTNLQIQQFVGIPVMGRFNEILENHERMNHVITRRRALGRLPKTPDQILKCAGIGQNVPLSIAINDGRKTHLHLLLSYLGPVSSHDKIHTDKLFRGEFQNQTRLPVEQVKKLLVSRK
jgi:hypothetical protein